MASLDGKHSFGSIGETRVTFVEKGVDEGRKDFLKQLLEHNGLEVVLEEEKKKEEGDPQLYTVAVTDMVFNPTIWIFERKMRTLDGLVPIESVAIWANWTGGPCPGNSHPREACLSGNRM